MGFNYDEIYTLHPSARLRNDKKYVIAGLPSGESVSTLRLAPIEGAVVSLLNGKRSCSEVEDICMAMTEKTTPAPEKAAKNAVKVIVTKHLEPARDMPYPLIVSTSRLSPQEIRDIPQYDPVNFIVTKDAYKPNDFKLAYPIGLLWLLTNECQTMCQYCYLDKSNVKKDDMLSWERTRELVLEAHNNGLMGISISGGDPMCYPHVFDFLDLLEELHFPPISIPTKTYVSPKIAKRLAEYSMLEELQFSIDSTVPEIADFLVQSPGFCERTLESIDNARNAGIEKIVVKSVITPYNLPTIPRLYRDLKARGVSSIRLATYCKSGYNHKEKLFNHVDDYKWFDKELDKLRAEFPDDGIYYQNGPPQPEYWTQEYKEEQWPKRSRCTAGRDNMTIAPNGRVVACEQMPLREEDYLGNLHVQSIEEVWNAKPLNEYLIHPPREKFTGTECFECEEFDECQSLIGVCVRDCCIHYGTRWCTPPNCPKAPPEPKVRLM